MVGASIDRFSIWALDRNKYVSFNTQLDDVIKKCWNSTKVNDYGYKF